IALNQAYDEPDVRAAWEAAQRAAGVTIAPAGGAEPRSPAPSPPGEGTPGLRPGSESPPDGKGAAVDASEETEKLPHARVWVGIAGALDFAVIGAANDVNAGVRQ